MTYYSFNQLTSTLKSMEGINSDERYFEGLLTVQMKDKQGEVTIVDELYKVLPVWIDRGAPISDTHSNRIVGKGINYSRTTVKSDDGSVLPAIKITGKIFKNYELDNVIWEKIKNNEYKGLSFGGATRSARSPIKMKDGTTAYALSDLEHYEVAVCKDPAVPMAIITDFNQIAKANFNSSVRDDGKMVIQCDNMGCVVNKNDDEEDEEFYHDEEGEIIDKADLNESQTFEQKVQALIAEGKSRESAEKIVGSFVHKEVAGGNGMGGGANSSGNGGMSGGGTLTTDSGGTNNPRHDSKCDCKDCKDDDKCDCGKCKNRGLDITNTNSTGTSSAYNQDAPNGSRLNNKADAYPEIKRDIVDDAEDKESKNFKDLDKAKGDYCPNCGKGKKDLPDTTTMGGACPNCGHGFKSKFMEKKEMFEAVIDNPEENTKGKIEKGDGSTNTEDRNNRTDLNDIISQKRQFNGTKGTLSEELPNMTIANPIKNGKNASHKAKSTREINKVHALMKLNKVIGKMPKNPKDYTADEEMDTDMSIQLENNNQYQAHSGYGQYRDANSGMNVPDVAGRIFTDEYTAEGKLKKALEALTKEMIGVGSGIRGGGQSYAHTQSQGDSVRITIVPPVPEDDRISSKRIKNRKEQQI